MLSKKSLRQTEKKSYQSSLTCGWKVVEIFFFSVFENSEHLLNHDAVEIINDGVSC